MVYRRARWRAARGGGAALVHVGVPSSKRQQKRAPRCIIALGNNISGVTAAAIMVLP